LSELHLIQEKQYKEIRIEHDLQKQEKDKERKELQLKIDKLLAENKEERKKIEDAAWENIDIIKDKNKEELALIIDAGISSKGKLIEV
jgi:nicotinamide riboside kinase